MSTQAKPYNHPDHWSQSHRDLIAHLRAQHLPGVDADDDALVIIDIEQARLLLVTAGGLLGLTLTQMVGIDKSICMRPVYYEAFFLIAALALGWSGILLGGRRRYHRIKRRYDIYNAALDAHMDAIAEKRSIDLTKFDETFDNGFKPERKIEYYMRIVRNCAAVSTFLGIGFAAFAAVGTVVPSSCVGNEFSSPPRVQQLPITSNN